LLTKKSFSFVSQFAHVGSNAPKVSTGASHVSPHICVKFCLVIFRIARVTPEKLNLDDCNICGNLAYRLLHTMKFTVTVDIRS